MDGTLVTHLRYVQRGSLRARAPSVGGRARGGAGGRGKETREEEQEEEEAQEAFLTHAYRMSISMHL